MTQKHLLTCMVIAAVFVANLPMTGCSALKPEEPTPTATLFPTIRPPKPTRTHTNSPTPSPLPTGTPTITPSVTFPPPVDDFSQAKLYAFGPKPGWEFSFTLLLPDEIKGKYKATVGDPPKEFSCRTLIEYAFPDRLYCTGRIPKVDQNLQYKIMEISTGQIVFEGYVFSPLP